MATDIGEKTYLAHDAQQVDDALEAVAALPEQLAAKQDALTFGTQTAQDSTDALNSGAIWASVLAQILGLNTFTNLAAGDDLNDFTTPGIYRCTGSAIAAQLVNMPSPIAQQAGGRLIVFNVGGAGRYIQFYISAGARFWLRSNTSAGWQPWYEYAGAEVTPAASTNAVGGETA
jgi:hypothetical protein